ncbi:cupin domain-containing protein [Tessaracoccus palaemonis]|uniref:Cupin domain-containing protein n=1 Tax=Tessaracoccus palaemonis TaxID=2829499 RepID=A0ABX8SNS1_9ACTN|nr:cupin domain-containing protein [Tessaracoccus palaemonis]QXT63718.1 cupin domain-containing protein [Tessaracoccus palaemonis]
MPIYTEETIKTDRQDWVIFHDYEYFYLDPRGDAAPVTREIADNGKRQFVLCLGGGVIVRSINGTQKLERTGWIEVPEGGVRIDSTGATKPGDQAQLLYATGDWEGLPHIGVFWAWPHTPLEVHYHDFDEYWFIVSGHSEAEADGSVHQVGPGTLIATARGYEHGMPNVGELVTGVCFEPALGPDQRRGHLHRHEHGDPVPSREI